MSGTARAWCCVESPESWSQAGLVGPFACRRLVLLSHILEVSLDLHWPVGRALLKKQSWPGMTMGGQLQGLVSGGPCRPLCLRLMLLSNVLEVRWVSEAELGFGSRSNNSPSSGVSWHQAPFACGCLVLLYHILEFCRRCKADKQQTCMMAGIVLKVSIASWLFLWGPQGLEPLRLRSAGTGANLLVSNIPCICQEVVSLSGVPQPAAAWGCCAIPTTRS